MPKFISLVGKKIGRWTVLKRIENRIFKTSTAIQYLCECACKNRKKILATKLLQNRSKSCGCYRVDVVSSIFTHKKINTPEYKIWAEMIQRCTNKKNKSYKNYGARGISVCKRWRKFENFYNDMGKRPEKFSLERINNNKNYTKSNCRWIPKINQSLNTRNTKLSLSKVKKILKMISEKKHTQRVIAEIFNISSSHLYRIKNNRTLWNKILMGEE